MQTPFALDGHWRLHVGIENARVMMRAARNGKAGSRFRRGHIVVSAQCMETAVWAMEDIVDAILKATI